MEEKVFELLSKLYGEMKEGFAAVDKRFESVDKRFEAVDKKIEGLSKQVLDLENDLKPKVEAALEGYKIVYEKLTSLELKVDIINTKVDKHDVELQVIRNAR